MSHTRLIRAAVACMYPCDDVLQRHHRALRHSHGPPQPFLTTEAVGHVGTRQPSPDVRICSRGFQTLLSLFVHLQETACARERRGTGCIAHRVFRKLHSVCMLFLVERVPHRLSQQPCLYGKKATSLILGRSAEGRESHAGGDEDGAQADAQRRHRGQRDARRGWEHAEYKESGAAARWPHVHC